MFELPNQICELLKNYKSTWAIAGGWAIDLFLDKKTREHQDIEIAIPRSEQFLLRSYLKDWKLQYIYSGTFIDWDDCRWLELPVHEIRASKDDQSLEILINEIEKDVWRYRRNTNIEYPLKNLIFKSKNDIPILCPEVVLLYKAKTLLEKDHLDFNNTIDTLSISQRNFLFKAIRICHGEKHHWI